MCNSKIDKINNIMDGKYEKTENGKEYYREKKLNGLYERTEECKTLLTEDNKMLLND